MKLLSGKNSTREIILETIKAQSRVTVDALAKAASVSPVTVRHHLNSLQADGLVSVESVRQSVGRPYYVYSLTEAGHELFPTKYFALSMRLLDELKDRFPAEVVNEVFSGVVRRIAQEHRGEFEHLPFEKRLDYLVDLLAQEGFLARWRKVDSGYELTEYSCPFLLIGEDHSEVCRLDTVLIETVLETNVEQQSCMLQGDACCQFKVAPVISLSEVETP